MLTRIRNGYLAGKEQVEIPYSKIKEQIAQVLQKEGYLQKVKLEKIAAKKHKKLVCQLKYQNNKPAISKISRISKPGLRIYAGKDKLPIVLNGLGRAVISTSQGIMTAGQARKKGLGGELICKVW